MLERVWLIKDWEFIERLSRDELRRLENKSRARSQPAGSALQFPADAATHVFLLSRGRARGVVGSDPRGLPLVAEIDPGDLFGPCAASVWAPAASGIEFLKDATTIAIPREVLEKVLRSRRDMTRTLKKQAGRTERLQRTLGDMLFKSTGRRVCHLISEIGRRLGRRTANAVEISATFSDRELAWLVGGDVEVVRAALDELHSLRILDRQQRRLTILDEGRLANWVHQELREPTKSTGTVRVVR